MQWLTASENSKKAGVDNRHIRHNTKKDVPGIYQTPSGSWRAHIRCSGERYYLGTYADPNIAAFAYEFALHGIVYML